MTLRRLGRCRCSTRYFKMVALISRRGEEVPLGNFRRCRKPVESAFETKKVVSYAVEYIKISIANTRTSADFDASSGDVVGIEAVRKWTEP